MDALMMKRINELEAEKLKTEIRQEALDKMW